MWYWYYFANGHRECVKGFSKQELAYMERTHGKLVIKFPAP
jgi:hypothetical protein